MNTRQIALLRGINVGKTKRVAMSDLRTLLDRLGFPVKTLGITAGELDEIVQSNPLVDQMTDPSHMAAAIYFNPEDRQRVLQLERKLWTPEAFAAGRLAAYLWCPDGFTGSPLSAALGKALGDRATSRNWATLLRIQAAC